MTASPKSSPRLQAVIWALPLRLPRAGDRLRPRDRSPSHRSPTTTGHILAIDRSSAAIAQAKAAAHEEIASGHMDVRHVAAEDFVLQPDEAPYHLVFAVRVGALDGRYPNAGERALQRVARATTANARLFIDGGNPLRELRVPKY